MCLDGLVKTVLWVILRKRHHLLSSGVHGRGLPGKYPQTAQKDPRASLVKNRQSGALQNVVPAVFTSTEGGHYVERESKQWELIRGN